MDSTSHISVEKYRHVDYVQFINENHVSNVQMDLYLKKYLLFTPCFTDCV